MPPYVVRLYPDTPEVRTEFEVWLMAKKPPRAIGTAAGEGEAAAVRRRGSLVPGNRTHTRWVNDYDRPRLCPGFGD